MLLCADYLFRTRSKFQRVVRFFEVVCRNRYSTDNGNTRIALKRRLQGSKRREHTTERESYTYKNSLIKCDNGFDYYAYGLLTIKESGTIRSLRLQLPLKFESISNRDMEYDSPIAFLLQIVAKSHFQALKDSC